MLKKIRGLTVLLALIFVVTTVLVACGNSDKTSKDNTDVKDIEEEMYDITLAFLAISNVDEVDLVA